MIHDKKPKPSKYIPTTTICLRVIDGERVKMSALRKLKYMCESNGFNSRGKPINAVDGGIAAAKSKDGMVQQGGAWGEARRASGELVDEESEEYAAVGGKINIDQKRAEVKKQYAEAGLPPPKLLHLRCTVCLSLTKCYITQEPRCRKCQKQYEARSSEWITNNGSMKPTVPKLEWKCTFCCAIKKGWWGDCTKCNFECPAYTDEERRTATEKVEKQRAKGNTRSSKTSFMPKVHFGTGEHNISPKPELKKSIKTFFGVSK
jgi:hypothetical protein